MRQPFSGLTRSIGLIFLVSVAPFLSFYAHNVQEISDASPILVFAAGAFFLSALFYLLLNRLVRTTGTRLVSAYAVFIILFWNFGNLESSLNDTGFRFSVVSLIWFSTTALAVVIAFVFGNRRAFFTLLFFFAAAGIVLPALDLLVRVDGGESRRDDSAQAYSLGSNVIWSGNPVRRPSIYWIFADSYPNTGVLKEYYGFDNSEFVALLKERGFYVAEESFSNFNLTLASVPSTFNAEYAFEPPGNAMENGEWKKGQTNSGLFNAVLGDNRSVSFLKQLGYRYVHYDHGWLSAYACGGYEDICIQNKPFLLSDLETQLLFMAPFQVLVALFDRGSSGFFHHHVDGATRAGLRGSGTGVPEFGENLAAIEIDDPIFVYAHFMSPHAPFTNDANCETIDTRFLKSEGEELNALFVGQVQCLNRHFIDLVDGIIARDPEAIIVLAGDHGPRHSVPKVPRARLDDFGDVRIRESLGILNAIRVPEECAAPLNPRWTLVNTMRLVFACMGGQEPRLVEPKHFILRWNKSNPDAGKIREVFPN